MTMVDTGVMTLWRGLFREAHGWLEGTIEGVTADQAHWSPGGEALPIAAHYVHTLATEDYFLNVVVGGGAPLGMTLGAETGISEPPPPGAWSAWAHRVRVQLPATRAYARELYAATDRALAELTPVALERVVDLTALGLGQQTVSYILHATLLNTAAHCGEIACLKGLQGQRGYPF
jgi:hypothetical protein